MRAAEVSFKRKTQDPVELNSELNLVMERVRLLARRRSAWLDFLQEEAETSKEPLEDRDDPAREARWISKYTPALNERLAGVEAALQELPTSRLVLLANIFSLSHQDQQIFQVCLALALDPTLGSVFAYLNGRANRPFANAELAARLLGLGRTLVWPSDSPLKIWQLVDLIDTSSIEPQAIACDPQIRDWLLGSNDIHPALIGRARLRTPIDPPDSWPVDQVVDFIQRVAKEGQDHPAWIEINGLPGSGRRTLAACAASQVGLPLLAIDADAIPDGEWEQVYIIAQRQAYLGGWALAWIGESLSTRRWPTDIPAFPIQFGIAQPGQTLPVPSGKAAFSVRIPSLSIDEREALWRSAIPAASAWRPGELRRLATRFKVTPGEVAAISRQGIDSPQAAAASVRAGQRDQLGSLAQRLDCPFGWSDLIVGQSLREALDDFVFEARERAIFWEQPKARRLFPQGRGLAALFSGPPGTGKTMAAQVIAADLGLDLFRVDLSSVVSKYVGETSQNLERILSRAENMDIVLFFDESDALFGKRTEIKDAHDRFANTDTNYLLQAIENYAGIVLLASNKKANIEPAFIRRLRYVLEFPLPDENQRLTIWNQIVAELADEKTARRLESRLRALAKEVSLTGAQIKFSILAAVFVARKEGKPLQIQHLLRGLQRELLKEGRSLSEREMEKLRA